MKRGQSQTQQQDIQGFFKKKSCQMQTVQVKAKVPQARANMLCKHGTASTGYSQPERTSEGYNSSHLPAATDIPSDESSQTSEGEEDQSLIRLCNRSGSDSKGDSDREHHPDPSGLTFAVPVGPQDISQSRAVGPVQPNLKMFPQQGKKNTADGRRGDKSVEVRGLLGQIYLPFIGLLATFCKVLSDTKLLSDMLQSPSRDQARAVELNALQDTFQKYREESFCDEIWREILNTAQNCNISIESVKKRQRQTSSRLEGSVVTSTVGERRSDQDDKDGFRKNIFYPILDSVIGELQKRFSKPNCNIMRGEQQASGTLTRSVMNGDALISD
ncbi:hypothetical protein G5714_000545 [Onychostoma macrolepis]|uniref:Uncharacterized protein n=1 Tax=Onychostoma macrolepis TaxID=369639 RepID=A0A7J6DI72_9TELE|nr:hypothetical protein G5714_000545 [Onychostoma macrolepis]